MTSNGKGAQVGIERDPEKIIVTEIILKQNRDLFVDNLYKEMTRIKYHHCSSDVKLVPAAPLRLCPSFQQCGMVRHSVMGGQNLEKQRSTGMSGWN